MSDLTQIPNAGQIVARLPDAIFNAHVLVMRTGGLVNRMLDRTNAMPASVSRIEGPWLQTALAAGSLACLSARLGGCVKDGIVVLERLRVQGIQPTTTPAVEAPAAQPAPASPAAPKFPAAPGLARGRLRNGNPSGDFLAAPRCGAKTRTGGCCRQPGMANGRCRFHGGKSTGARTAEGLARCRTARLVHGGRTRALIDLRSRACLAARQLRGLVRAARATAAGHGVDRSFAVSGRAPRTATAVPATDRRSSALIPSLSRDVGGSNPGSAGYRVDCSVSDSLPAGLLTNTTILDRPLTRRFLLCSSVFINGPTQLPAGHGVDRSDLFARRAA